MNLTVPLKKSILSFNKQVFAIRTIWLFHVSAMIGVSLGFFDFFIPKTALNLSVAFGLLIWVFPLDSLKKIVAASLFFGVGFLVEYLGANYGFLFGEYNYGQNLGLKFKEVPFLIGINWAMLVLITGAIANDFMVSKPWKVLIGASLMLLLDLPMEVVAPIFDFWEFSGGIAPLQNYVAWFVVASFLHAIFQALNIKGDPRFSVNLYLCQFVFFTYFYVFYSN